MKTKLVQARGRINAGGLGLCGVGFVAFGLVPVGSCESRSGRSKTAIAVGAVRLRRLVAGSVWMRPGWARHGGASCCMSRLAALVIGTKPLRRGGAEWKGGHYGR
jgi:hypothetical protein